MNKLTISLSAIAENYRALCEQAWCGAVVKANGYGLGAGQVAAKLAGAGCGSFFVATLEEGVALRQTLREGEIFVFHGVQKNEAAEFKAHNLIPILNNLSQLENWEKDQSAFAHFDTGMTRLGFARGDVGKVKEYNILLIMSHLANAEDAENPENKLQLERFTEIGKHFSDKPKSLANSAGIFLGKDYHFDLARPGIALYGGLGMKNVVKLEVPIIQVHEVTGKQRIGYGGEFTAEFGDTTATIPIGYADGILRKLGNRAKFHMHGHELPVVGRVSMDLITIKLNNLPPHKRKIGEMVEVLGENYNISQMAADAETIDYEIITRLGNRFERIYV